MSPVEWAGPVTGTNEFRSISPWVHMRTLSPVSEMRKGQRSWERVPATESTMERIRCYEESIPAFIYPGNRAEVFIWQNF